MAVSRSPRRTVMAIAGVFATRSMGMVLATITSVLIGNRFGVGTATDGFFFARRIASGCAEAAQRVTAIVLVPGLTAKLNSRDPHQARHAWAAYLRKSLIWGLPITAAVALLAPVLVKLLGPGFTPEGSSLAANLLRIMLFTIPVTVSESISGSVMNAGRKFAAAALIPLLARLCVVLALIFMVPPWNVTHLAWVTLWGSALAALILGWVARRKLPDLIRSGEMIETRTRGEAGRLFWPGFLAFFSSQAFIWLEFGYASTLGSGAISEMEYGYRILAILPGVVSSSMTTVMYTEFSAMMARGDRREMYRELARTTRGGLFLMAPVIGFLAFQGENIAGIMLHHGAFPASSIKMVGDVMLLMAFSAIGQYWTRLYIFGAYADESVPALKMALIVLAVTLGTRIIFISALIGPMGVAGIALARSISTLFNVLAVYGVLLFYWGKFMGIKDLAAQVAMVVFTVLAMASTRWADDWLGFTPDRSVPIRLIGMGVVAVLGCVAYLGLAFVFRLPEVRKLKSLLRRGRAKGGAV